MIETGKNACSGLRYGADYRWIGGQIVRNQGYAAQEAADIIIAASKNMCPDTFPALQAAIAHPAPTPGHD